MADLQNKDPSTALPSFFDKNPELKSRLQNYLKKVTPEQKEENVEQYKKFIAGEIPWADVREISKNLQREMARVGYLKFQLKEYDKAETVFKSLSIIDHNNWYFRAALGAVYQKQKRYEEAVDEYSISLEIKDDELSCLVNRGECYMLIRDFESATVDFNNVIGRNLPANNPWNMRAVALLHRVQMIQKEAHHD